ncbi:MAG: hypothetical protein HY846_02910 [Nitrosomonadales bacterium]|nr:hypothetical protein [Nitrosomonadales bacterium]
MKLRKFVMTLTVAALLPAFAHAGSDPVAASFDRSFYNDAYIDSCRTKQDLVVASFDSAFGNESLISAYRIKSDLVLASFENDVSHEPVEVAGIAGEPDALTTQFYVALNGTADPVLASFERDMRDTTENAVVTVAGEPDVLAAEFYAALRDVVGKPVMHANTGGRIGG